jgi:quercetin dioxygenase-like cupin family protein
MNNTLTKKIEELTKAVENLKKIQFSNLVTKKYLELIKIGETVMIENVSVKKVHEGDYCMQFISVVPPKSKFPKHWHDVFELNIILNGEISEGGNIHTKGDVIRVKKEIAHTFKNMSKHESTVISTTFTDFETNFKT